MRQNREKQETEQITKPIHGTGEQVSIKKKTGKEEIFSERKDKIEKKCRNSLVMIKQL